jgi:DNA-binding transcriptional LysR family regulator
MLARLEAFIEVARQESVTRAAEALVISQPALTARIKRLEEELHAQLFLRTSNGMRLTEEGRAFLPYAERTLDTIAQGRNHLDDVRRGSIGELAIAAAPGISTYILPPLLSRFASEYPNVELTVHADRVEAVLEMVLQENAHLGLVRALKHPEIESAPFYEERLVLVSNPHHPNHPGRLRGKLTIEDISRLQLIMFDRTSSYHAFTNAFLRSAGVSPRVVMELDNIDSTKQMVLAGLGIAFLPQSAVAAELAAGSLREVEIMDVGPLRQQIVAIRRRDAGPPTRILASFLAILADMRPSQPVAERSAVG